MSILSNRLKKSFKSYMRRKNRVNSVLKSHDHENRIVINRSNKFISAQLIDKSGNVLMICDDKKMKWKTKTERAFAAWESFGKDVVAKKVDSVVFDRNGYLYHGRVKAFVEWLRKSWLSI